MNILVVDDSRAMRMIVRRVLGQVGFADATFAEAADGAEALAFVRATPPDLVLSDWNMPELSGIELLRAIRADGCTVPFGFVTSETSPAMREQAIAAGAQFLVAKPFNADSFEHVLSAVAAE